MVVKKCFVPSCNNTSENCNKIFISVPTNEDRRNLWSVIVSCKPYKTTTQVHCCEDHFDLEKDAKNWMFYKMAPAKKIVLHEDVVPHRYLNRGAKPPVQSQLSDSARKSRLAIEKKLKKEATKRKVSLESKVSSTIKKVSSSSIQEALNPDLEEEVEVIANFDIEVSEPYIVMGDLLPVEYKIFNSDGTINPPQLSNITNVSNIQIENKNESSSDCSKNVQKKDIQERMQIRKEKYNMLREQNNRIRQQKVIIKPLKDRIKQQKDAIKQRKDRMKQQNYISREINSVSKQGIDVIQQENDIIKQENNMDVANAEIEQEIDMTEQENDRIKQENDMDVKNIIIKEEIDIIEHGLNDIIKQENDMDVANAVIKQEIDVTEQENDIIKQENDMDVANAVIKQEIDVTEQGIDTIKQEYDVIKQEVDINGQEYDIIECSRFSDDDFDMVE